MITKQNITLAYELALKNYKNKSFTFMQIWKDLVKKCKFDEEEQKNISQFYIDLLQDKRFIFVGNKKWKIREFLKHDEIVKLENALYDFEQEDEENGDTYSKSETKKTNDNEIYYGVDEEDDEKFNYNQASKKDQADLLDDNEQNTPDEPE